MIDRTWFSRFLRHLARKWSRSILTTPRSLHMANQENNWLTKIHLEKWLLKGSVHVCAGISCVTSDDQITAEQSAADECCSIRILHTYQLSRN